MGRKLDQTLAVLNGLVGDYLDRTGNGLATELGLHRDGQRIELTSASLAAHYPAPSARVVVLVHGVMCTETVWDPPPGSALEHDYGALLARDHGLTPLYVRYNSGRSIANNGAALSQQLETLLDIYPVPLEELVLLGYSMGGLLLRSACHHAVRDQLRWPARVRRAFYVGTPHFGAPAERAGTLVAKVLSAIDDPYTKLIAEIGNLRSAGIQDLGHADLRAEDRQARDGRIVLSDQRHPVPLLPAIDHYLIAGALNHDSPIGPWFGDAIVPLRSATAGHGDPAADLALPPERVKILPGLGHLMLAHHPDVYAQLSSWFKETQ